MQMPTVVFYSLPSFESASYIKNLAFDKKCSIKIIGGSKAEWRREGIVEGSAIAFLTHREIFKIESSYCIYFGSFNKDHNGFTSSRKLNSLLNQANEFARINNLKFQVVLPFNMYTSEQKKIALKVDEILKFQNAKVLYIGDFIESKGKNNSRLLLDLIRSGKVGPNWKGKTIFFADSVLYFAVLTKSLFSYWSNTDYQVVTYKMLVDEFLKKLGLPDFINSKASLLPVTYVNQNVAVTEGSSVFASFVEKKAEVMPVKQPDTNIKKRNAPSFRIPRIKFKNKAAFLSLLLIISPFLAMIFSIMISFVNLFFLSRFMTGQSKSLIYASSQAIEFSEKVFISTSKIPLLGVVSNPFVSISKDTKDILELQKKASDTLNNSRNLVSFVFKGEESESNFNKLATDISLDLSNIHKTLSLLQGRNSYVFKLQKIFAPEINLEELKPYLLYASQIAGELPNVLSGSVPKTYMVLFQNNMELRPTGGFIGSFALVTFSGGKLIDEAVYDVYAADGQLKGHIEPPVQLKNYLGEANWYLRDSNWDPDFRISADRATWFLEKEMDRKVEGVIGLDMEFVKKLLKNIGPVTLSESKTVIDHGNIYEKIQYVVENNFFPGSHQKSNILSSLSEALILKLMDSDVSLVGKTVFESLEKKHIQLFSRNKLVQDAFGSLNWSGEVVKKELWGGLIDANLGVNKGNYFIDRSQKLTLNITPSMVNYKLEVNYINHASGDLGLKGRYKTYLRVLAPKGAIFENTKVYSGNESKDALTEVVNLTDRIEGGVLVEIPGSQQKTVEFNWSTPIVNGALNDQKLDFLWRKQAGTVADGLEINVNEPFALTLGAPNHYNTVLDKDFEVEIKIKTNDNY